MNDFGWLGISLMNFCVAAGTMAQPGQVGELPEGNGKELVQTVCFTCHSAFNITGSGGYDTAEHWQDVFGTMVKLPDAQAHTIGQYLATHFPARADRKPVLLEGDT